MKNLISLIILMLPLMGLQTADLAILSEDGGIVPIIQGKHGTQSLNFEACSISPEEQVAAIISRDNVVLYKTDFLGSTMFIDARGLEPGEYSLQLISESCFDAKCFNIY